ncbi:MatE family transporter [Schizosaccharomyces octosporus yFS286]|uniref:MatE family transporter n=1 Tax=Schizosaccharomyces octosporus (strain yFS286) TaxID=483514 RepID=S9QZK4_SCHOY|nr:MatE family transporter [Schizosaccharomyces octosporus yFS286]EPX71675.1 MatE family transporter [Schizosaccharomyces octosporus yFS286]
MGIALKETKYLLANSAPVILGYALQNSLQSCSVIITGRLGANELSVAAFAYMFAMSTGWLIALGGTTAFDTFGSNLWGAGKKHELGILFQTAIIILSFLYLPVCLVWWFSKPILIFLHQTPELAEASQNFLRYLIPGGLGYICFELLKKYLQTQEITRAGSYVLLVTSPLNIALNYISIHYYDLGLKGAPLATGFSYWLSFILLTQYAKYVKGAEAWGGWNRKCIDNIFPFLKLSLLGIIMVGTEWWAFEIVALMAGKLGAVPLAAQSIIMTTDQLLNTIPFGLGIITSNRIAYYLGAGLPNSASSVAEVAAVVGATLGTVIMIIMIALRQVFGKLFTEDPDVINLVAIVLPLVAIFQISDSLNGTMGGALRGTKRQEVGAMVNISAYYLFSLPLGISLAFHGKGLAGLWIGQVIALSLVGILELKFVMATDWYMQARKAVIGSDEPNEYSALLGRNSQ